MPIGVHTSIAGGLYTAVDRAVLLGCDCVQIFSRNPRSWAFKKVPETEISVFKERRAASGLWPVVVHTTYLMNLATPSETIFDKSIDLFKKELGSAEALGADYLVTHLGSPLDMGDAYAVRRILAALKEVAIDGLGKKTGILLENTAGSGYGFGSSLREIGDIMDGANDFGLKTGLCFDTCHGFAAGYPLNATKDVNALIRAINKEAGGLKRLKLVHLNDSKGARGSRLDRHEHIGKGKIGLEGFKALLGRPEFSKIPMILETPKKTEEDDRRNLSTVRRLLKRR